MSSVANIDQTELFSLGSKFFKGLGSFRLKFYLLVSVNSSASQQNYLYFTDKKGYKRYDFLPMSLSIACI